MRQGKVYYKNHLAGIITETNEGEFVFQYDTQYVKDHPNRFHHIHNAGRRIIRIRKNDSFHFLKV